MEMKKKETVLVTAIGSFSAAIVVRSLREMGWRIVGCDIYPREWVATGLDVDRFYQVPLANKEEYMDRILELAEAEHVHYLMPLTDVEVDVLSMNRRSLEKKNVVLCISSARSVQICRNKYLFGEELKRNGILCTIPTYRCRDFRGNDLWRTHSTWVCKPVNGRSSEGLYYIDSAEKLERLLPDIDEDRYILQPYMGSKDSRIVTVDVVRQPELRQFAAMPRKEFLRTSNGAGTTVEIFQDENLESICKMIADLLGIRGCVNLEFIDDGNYWILECNPRFSGGVEFSCMSGYDFIRNHMRCFLGEPMDEMPKKRLKQIIARRYEPYVTKKME